jgi:L-ribulose-5-phosphate 4-epimerase
MMCKIFGLKWSKTMLEELREQLHKLHLELFQAHLACCTSGNISARDSVTGLVVIKPSGIEYSDLTPERMVIVNMEGHIVEGSLKPSVDTSTHLYIYRHRRDVNGIVHTHSVYATAFAGAGRAIPPILTSIADEFGGPIPCGGYAPIGDESIGHEVLASIGTTRAVLLKHHGVFTIGGSPKEALMMAIKTEEIAKTVYLASQLGVLEEMPAEEVAKARLAYREKYGQK